MPSCWRLHLISREWPSHRHFADDHGLARPRKPESEPDSKSREQECDDPAIDLERVLEYEIAVFDDFEDGDEDAAEDAVEEDSLFHEKKMLPSLSVR